MLGGIRRGVVVDYPRLIGAEGRRSRGRRHHVDGQKGDDRSRESRSAEQHDDEGELDCGLVMNGRVEHH